MLRYSFSNSIDTCLFCLNVKSYIREIPPILIQLF